MQSRSNIIAKHHTCIVCNKIIFIADHSFKLHLADQDGDVNHITMQLDGSQIDWFFESKIMMAYSFTSHKDLYLPWVEPDFSDCDRLFKKIRLYILFS
jgi:hypothetical protein